MKTIIATIALSLAAFQAVAETATITQVVPFYSNRVVSIPQEVCQDQQVPVYGTVQSNRGATATDVITGMVIGGALGNAVNGKDGATAGAVLGGIVGADSGNNKTEQVITGYRVVRNCTTSYSKQSENVLSSYNVVYQLDNSGIVGRGIIRAGGREPKVGDKINVKVTTQISN